MNEIASRSRSLATRPAASAGGALLGAIAGALSHHGWSGVAVGIVAGSVGAVAALVDIRERRIPDEIVLAGLTAAVAIVVVVSVTSEQVVGSALVGATAAGLPLVVIHLVDPNGLGFGDVKLGAVLGALLGIVAWVLGMLLLAAASVIALVGIAVLRSWRRSIPFGACLAAGALVVLAGAGWLADTWSLR